MQFKGASCNLKGFRGPVPYGAIGCPYKPSVPLNGALLNCQIVRHSPGFNYIGLWVASKNIGLGRTECISVKFTLEFKKITGRHFIILELIFCKVNFGN